MSLDDDADDDPGLGPPLPPEDRLWRHPSELSSWGPGGTPPGSPITVVPPARAPAWPIAMVAGLVGAALCGSALAVTGALTPDPADPVVEKVAVTPIISNDLMAPSGGRSVAALVEKLAPAVVHLVVTDGGGTTHASGVIVRDDGLVVTSAHEVADATSISVLLSDGRRVVGELIGADLPTDVAVLSIDAEDLIVAVLGTSSGLAVGSPIEALGWSPQGGSQPSVATGVVSAVEHRLDAAGESLHGMIQTDTPIEPAWSGGPLVDASGAVIGITTDLAGGQSGFGFATPIDLVRLVARQLIDAGTVARGWLGIEGTDLSMAEAARVGLWGGATVEAVRSGSPAERAGLQPDDVITEVGGHRILSSSGLVVALRHHWPGESIDVVYWRGDRRHVLTLTLVEHP